MDSLNHSSESTYEIGKLLLLLFVILPLSMAVSVGIYGFIVWFLQMFVIGLPSA
ncbi:TPA: nitrate/trimethylamine N-oxide reductase NapE/TorE [Haemophilus influenzae]|uniref:Periplasmic nitrate reductase protein NapE n=1 Tax=Haemophilus influenzae TaxID=727 RepID=A0A2S9RS80_HAEIF|nr:nitrate/trimethylamine N-oxide reductase NapE/TorE [Haemophilus influenzae]AWP53783.1 nitrate/trimethylamine N-oxide reductase NapE/TorE [Haemophilus influenzae]PRI36636.1 Periplasmic nitrate reductase protein NapE [Haemophilus influenzae]PRI42752.1 Periplasmic nitrate reductase protein NapE [Haemophilus influenzae]PRI88096.1 Periplasmic nitrate reductase protein NapE [Haemophilus influenzae]PRI88966.1 Periplasmic nitrate reductase protein NapE [Haemophilus influenzae]